jgi:hypothetical protein
MPAPASTTSKKPLQPASAFLSPEALEDVAKDSKSESLYISPSKLPEGKEHRFRVFGAGLTGYEGWITNEAGKKKPVRYPVRPELDELPANIAKNQDGTIQEPKRFLSALVWDYEHKKFGILQVTQRSILSDLSGLMADEEDFGDIHNYDIKITRTGSGLDTRYDTKGAQIKPPPADATAAYEDPEFFCDLALLMDNLDPWDPKAKDKQAESPDDLED